MDKMTEKGIKLVQKRMQELWELVDETDATITKVHKDNKRYSIVSYCLIVLCMGCFIMDLICHTKWAITALALFAVFVNIGFLVYAHKTIEKFENYRPLPNPHDIDPLLDSLGFTKRAEQVFESGFDFAGHRQAVADLIMFGNNTGKSDDIRAVLYKYGLMEPVSVALINANVQNDHEKHTEACRAFSDLSNKLEQELYTVDSPVIEKDCAKDNGNWTNDAIGKFLKENNG